MIIDDYGAIPACAHAVTDFRKEHGIEDEIRRLIGAVAIGNAPNESILPTYRYASNGHNLSSTQDISLPARTPLLRTALYPFQPCVHQMHYADETLYRPARFKEEIEALEGDKILLSNENFIGQSLYWNHGNRTRIATRLHAAMPEATIILFLRNQTDILPIALHDLSPTQRDKDTENSSGKVGRTTRYKTTKPLRQSTGTITLLQHL